MIAGSTWRHRHLRSAFALAICATSVGCAAFADDVDPIRISDAWARPADVRTTSGAYLIIDNSDTVPIVLTGMTSPDARVVELHESMQHDGMVHMTPHDSITLAPQSSYELKPGGMHAMLIDLTRPLAVGDSVSLTLTFADGRTRSVRAPVAVR